MKYHNHTLHTNPWHRGEMTQNTIHQAQTHQWNFRSVSLLSLRPDCKTTKDSKYYIAKQGPNTKLPRSVYLDKIYETPTF